MITPPESGPESGPESCATMAELRKQIDRLDAQLLDLLRERQGYIQRAITLKTRENMPARTTDRVAQVLSRVRQGAVDRGLDPALIEALWAALIEHAIAHEERVLGRSEAP